MNEEPKKWNSVVALGVGVGALALLFLFAGNVIPVSKLFSGAEPASNLASPPQPPAPIITDSGLFMYDGKKGEGAEAKKGMRVTVNYRGTLGDGTEFDSTEKHGQPFTFTLGAGEVIKGWDEGIVGMKVGGTRTILVPPELGYGDQAMGPIPANSLLNFDIELLSVEGETVPQAAATSTSAKPSTATATPKSN